MSIYRELEEVSRDEDVHTQLFLEQDEHYVIGQTFLKQSDPSLNYNDPIQQLLLSFFLPIFLTLIWLCIPLVGEPYVKFLIFIGVFQPCLAIAQNVMLWTLLHIYLPTPSPRTRFLASSLALMFNCGVILNILWIDLIDTSHGKRFPLFIALFAMCIPVFYTQYAHVKMITRIGKTETMGASAIIKITGDIAGEVKPLTGEKKTKE